MARMPRDRVPEAAPFLLREGYRFIGRRCRRYGSDAFRTRLLLQPTVCMRGPAAARLYYDSDRFVRQGAAPRRIRRTLFGEGGVQGLDGAAHQRRKQLFLTLTTHDAVTEFVDTVERHWRDAASAWETRGQIVLLDEAQALLCRAACEWAGIALTASELERRTRELSALVEAPGAIGPAHWAGRRARQRAERWAAGIMRAVRASVDGAPPPGSAAHTIAWHRDRDRDGALLDERLAAVELLNVLRPTVAVSRYLVFLAHALHEQPASAAAVREGGDAERERFVQEVRRYYPFFPFAVARVRNDFEWYGYPFERGERVLLDLYGTNHDARTWTQPEQFSPQRFRAWGGSAFDFVPQGGGDHLLGHRCPGEWITIALMKRVLEQLTTGMDYRVPPQHLRVDLARMPAVPRSGLVLDRVQVH